MTIFSQAIWGIRTYGAANIIAAVVLGCGILAFVHILGILNGFSQSIENESFGIYSTSLVISENSSVQDPYDGPLLDDMNPLGEISEVSSMGAFREEITTIVRNGKRREVLVFGLAGEPWPEVSTSVAEGRFLTAFELLSRDRVCMLGSRFRRAQFGQSDAVGKTIRIGAVSCDVVGVLSRPSSLIEERFDAAVLAPFELVSFYLAESAQRSPKEASWVRLTFPPKTDLIEKQAAADLLLRSRRGVSLKSESPFRFQDPRQSAQSLKRQRTLVFGLLSLVAVTTGVAVLVGYAGLTTNMMEKRVQEIAIRSICGSKPSALALQLALERLIVGVTAAFISATLYIVSLPYIQKSIAFNLSLNTQALGAAIFVGVFLSLLLSAAPVIKTLRSSPASLL